MNRLRELESRAQLSNLASASATGPALFLALNWGYELTNYAYLGQDQWELLFLTSSFNLLFFATRKYSSIFLLMSGLEHYSKIFKDVLIISALLTLAIFILNLSAGRTFLIATALFLLLFWLPYRKLLAALTRKGLRSSSVLVISTTDFINEYLTGLFGKVIVVSELPADLTGWDLVLFHNQSEFDLDHELKVSKLEASGPIVGYISNELKLEGWSGVQLVMGPHLMRIRPFLILSQTQRFLKRSFDLVISSVVLLLLIPFLPISYFWFITVNAKPYFFQQDRVGKDGKLFRILKIRTLVNQAELPVTDKTHRASWHPKPTNSQLVKAGAFLRRWSIDELPQFWNVVKGDMSLVGPRPRISDEIDDNYKLLSPAFQAKLKPGVTGLWQISGRSLNTLEYSNVLDKYYLDHWSPVMDIQIMLKTLSAIKLGVGAK